MKFSYTEILSLLGAFIEDQSREIQEDIYDDLIQTCYKKYNELVNKKIYKEGE